MNFKTKKFILFLLIALFSFIEIFAQAPTTNKPYKKTTITNSESDFPVIIKVYYPANSDIDISKIKNSYDEILNELLEKYQDLLSSETEEIDGIEIKTYISDIFFEQPFEAKVLFFNIDCYVFNVTYVRAMEYECEEEEGIGETVYTKTFYNSYNDAYATYKELVDNYLSQY